VHGCPAGPFGGRADPDAHADAEQDEEAEEAERGDGLMGDLLADLEEAAMRMGLTVAEALQVLDPPPKRWQLEILIARSGLAAVDTRQQHTGRPAAVYDIADLYEAHAQWVRERAQAGLPIPAPTGG
jgi:hypothetical protein